MQIDIFSSVKLTSKQAFQTANLRNTVPEKQGRTGTKFAENFYLYFSLELLLLFYIFDEIQSNFSQTRVAKIFIHFSADPDSEA